MAISESGNIHLINLHPHLGRQASAERMISPRHEWKKGHRSEQYPKKLSPRSLFCDGLVAGHCLDGHNDGYGGGDDEFDDWAQRPSRPCLQARNFFT